MLHQAEEVYRKTLPNWKGLCVSWDELWCTAPGSLTGCQNRKKMQTKGENFTLWQNPQRSLFDVVLEQKTWESREASRNLLLFRTTFARWRSWSGVKYHEVDTWPIWARFLCLISPTAYTCHVDQCPKDQLHFVLWIQTRLDFRLSGKMTNSSAAFRPTYENLVLDLVDLLQTKWFSRQRPFEAWREIDFHELSFLTLRSSLLDSQMFYSRLWRNQGVPD